MFRAILICKKTGRIKLHLQWYFTPSMIKKVYGKGGSCWKCNNNHVGLLTWGGTVVSLGHFGKK